MVKIKITSEQYKAILLREQETRLKVSNSVLNENLDLGPELLEEGWKEVVLGVAMLMGVGLTGPNKAMAQDALSNEKTMAQIKTTLEDETKTQELAKAFQEKGMKNPDTLLAKNAEKIKDKFNEIAKDNHIKYNVNTKVVDNLVSLDSELAKGYALKKADLNADKNKPDSVKTVVVIKDSLKLELSSDDLFINNGSTLSSDGINIIKSIIDEILQKNGKILSINIETSTDAETHSKLKTDEDQTGNIQLASLRTKSISNLLSDLDNDIRITHREIPNNGSDVVNYQIFKKYKKDEKTLKALREKTFEFRYVNLKIIFEIQDKSSEEKPKPEEVVKKYRFELTKVVTSSDSKNNLKFYHKKINCKHQKNINLIRCSTL